ncbi:uncharacterized protein [Epargyreus clarus]|uniref:uncharacterized protein n=1 Tax=Epargyreus clarus TaxID=520877 RepID=UPI003C2EE954
MSASPDPQPPPGVVELREDLPLKASSAAGGAASGSAHCAGGPRLILAAFAALSAAITLALLTQIYYGDYEVVPHGSVAASGAECSRAGTGALRAGGRALDAAAAAALCLAVLAPHRTSLDASGALLYWEYRSSRWESPTLAEWGGAEEGAGGAGGARPPRLLAALAALHERYGALPWPQLLQPAIDIARKGFLVSEGLAQAAEARGLAGYVAGQPRTEPALADFLETLQLNTSAELCAAWRCAGSVRTSSAAATRAGSWRVWAAGAGGRHAAAALAAALPPPPATAVPPDDTLTRVVVELQQQAAGVAAWPAGVASGLAVVDPQDTYVALVTGLSTAFGSDGAAVGAAGNAAVDAAGSYGWARDTPRAPLDLAPALLVDEHVCGTRYVIGAESGAALAQSAAAALAGGAPAAAAEGARVALAAGGALAREAGRAAPAPLAAPLAALLPRGAALNASRPYAAVNLIQQRGDALLSHADSRGGGIASRF